MWILIILALNGNAVMAVHTTDFSTHEGCMEAKSKLDKLNIDMKTLCVKDIE